MSLFIPGHFACTDRQVALQLIHNYPFATLVTDVPGEELHVSHIPLLYEDGALLGHLARANPHWQRLEKGGSLAMFNGPHAFISPYWYERPDDNVPTWNYAVVHAHGRAAILDAESSRLHLQRLFARFGDNAALPTREEKFARLLDGIAAFRMPIDRLDTKIKMNQNRTAADRAGVIAGLLGTGRPEDAAVAEWMSDTESSSDT